MNYLKSDRLNNLSYAIRGPIFDKAEDLAAHGHKIIHLNIGNPAPFGFDVPDEIMEDMIMNLRNAQGYSHHLGIFPARKAVMHYTQQIGIPNVRIEDIFIGNGVSELIVMTLQALLNPNDEILIPSPDYPLWTTAVGLSGGKAVHYVCDEASDWNPDVADIASKITPKTKGIVLINPNNPTGAVYEKDVLKEIVKLAEEHNLIVFSDEIYDKILYDGHTHVPTASLSEDVLFMTYGGLSKNYRATGFRGGWVIASGAKHKAKSYLEGINLLASMRLCANVPAQYAIQTALGGYQSISDLVAENGRLKKQRDLIHYRLTDIPGISCVKPKGALYVFPKIDLNKFDFKSDEDFTLRLLTEHKVLVVPGSGFNAFDQSHFRIVFLPGLDTLNRAVNEMEELFAEARVPQKAALPV
ncbi:pyridoxal phosphate-dependent aminotransferase [Marinilongibacter aquaticus]|uniref:pyridoxal phosphate-dependent aminotransferase n=1 Tax=Marinilongibacter aquaticus TaxID=2975157 RepID=UPI0021BD00EE|nr:pyridoxal phosphate-dependent aminotransferase [Marinilongibacter aquaticus]UBM59214.1 pyridoxal phosphate-dependent aminotransferase [Marinilongibacter aquaticus]